jgi:hypothetical protein
MTMVPWMQGRSLVWDVARPDTLAPSYLNRAVTIAGPGAVATDAESHEHCNYETISHKHCMLRADRNGNTWSTRLERSRFILGDWQSYCCSDKRTMTGGVLNAARQCCHSTWQRSLNHRNITQHFKHGRIFYLI